MSHSFTATAPSAAGSAFDYTFTGSNGILLSGTGVVGAVPEPATTGLLAAGLLGLLALRRLAA